ncbi:transposase [Mesorhizobium sp. J8]|uniref:transposase n=1 Tax=Mesorhizobium sp. J8 TaxID=2777475 RepID=UPI001CD910F4
MVGCRLAGAGSRLSTSTDRAAWTDPHVDRRRREHSQEGEHSVASHQYCGQLGNHNNSQIALSLPSSMTHLPIAHPIVPPPPGRRIRTNARRLRPRQKSRSRPSRRERFADQEPEPRRCAPGVVLSDAGYGADSDLRAGLSELDFTYLVQRPAHTQRLTPRREPHSRPAVVSGRPNRRSQTKTVAERFDVGPGVPCGTLPRSGSSKHTGAASRPQL